MPLADHSELIVSKIKRCYEHEEKSPEAHAGCPLICLGLFSVLSTIYTLSAVPRNACKILFEVNTKSDKDITDLLRADNTISHYLKLTRLAWLKRLTLPRIYRFDKTQGTERNHRNGLREHGEGAKDTDGQQTFEYLKGTRSMGALEMPRGAKLERDKVGKVATIEPAPTYIPH